MEHQKNQDILKEYSKNSLKMLVKALKTHSININLIKQE